jgi:hypothetical protein
MTAHWGVPDPAAVIGTEDQQRRAFRDASWVLTRRINLFSCLPFDKLKGLALQEQLDRIGHDREPVGSHNVGGDGKRAPRSRDSVNSPE